MPARTRKSKPTANNLLEAYMQAVLDSGQFPATVYAFCKEQGWEESDFYEQFGSLDGLRRTVWTAFFEQAVRRLEQSPDFQAAPAREKVLGFFYTFFEVLALNRSYALFDLEHGRRGPARFERLSGLRKPLRDLAGTWLADAPGSGKWVEARQRLVAEGFWAQLLFLLDFWMHDQSAGFAKTDAAIEKSVHVLFDLLDHTPLERVIDFGKFLVQERFS